MPHLKKQEEADMSNTGLIADPRPIEQKLLDYVMGESPIKYEDRVVDWSGFVPEGEPQYGNGWDTMSCVTFSALHSLEAQLTYLLPKMSDRTLDFLESHGYLKNGVIRLSKRFTAITSETTFQGNYFHKVWDTIKKMGVIPDSDFPFGGNSFVEYHDKSLITNEMLAKGKAFLDYFSINYEWVYYDDNTGYSVGERSLTQSALKHAPVQIGIPIPAGHAIMQYNLTDISYGVLDHYLPFQRDNKIGEPGINFAMKGYIALKNYIFTRDLYLGKFGSDVKELQKFLNTNGFKIANSGSGSPGNETEYFGVLTMNALSKFQKFYGIYPTLGYFGIKTRNKVNMLV